MPRLARAIFSLITLLLCGWYNQATADEQRLAEGKGIYIKACAGCHGTGAAGVPQLASSKDWEFRLLQPIATLHQHAVKGFGNMLPKGGQSGLSDEEVYRAVDYMIYAMEDPDAARKIEASMESTTTDQSAAPKPALPSATSVTEAVLKHLKGDMAYHIPPADDQIPNDRYGDDVRLGQKIFTETWKYARRYAGNDLSCSNCHLDAGRRANSAPLWGAFGMYPSYREKNDRNNTLEERIQQCFRFSMNGFAPALDAPEVRALVSYIHFLSRGVPIGVDMPGRGYPQVITTGYDPNPTRGGEVFKVKCAMCHGEDGAGQKREGGGYTFPPLWGMGSFNKGAGLARNDLMAGFLKANMPLGNEWSLTDQEALDLAAYINQQLRPWDPRKGIMEWLLH